MLTTSTSWRDFGFSATELKTVEEGAEVFRFFKGDIENVFKLGRALRTLKSHNYGRGGQGDYALALIQYGFTNRSGGPLDEAIRSNIDKMLDNEIAVRRWWNGVPENKRYGWNNANTIYQNWQEFLDPTIAERRKAARAARAAAKAAKAGPQATQAQIDAIANAALNPNADPKDILAAIRAGKLNVGARPPGAPEGETLNATDAALKTAREFADIQRELADTKQKLAEAEALAAEPPSKPDVMTLVADLIAESHCFARGAHVFNRPQALDLFSAKEAEELAAWLTDFAKTFRKLSREQGKAKPTAAKAEPEASTSEPEPKPQRKRRDRKAKPEAAE